MDSTTLLWILNDQHCRLILVTVCVIILCYELFSYVEFRRGNSIDKVASFFEGRKTQGGVDIRTISEICRKYSLTRNGFLPEKCLERLPTYYDTWENIAAVLPELNRTGKLQDEVENMKLLSCDNLEDETVLRRAYIILGMLLHSYVNGGKVPWGRIGEYSPRSGCQEEMKLENNTCQMNCNFDSVNIDHRESTCRPDTLGDGVKSNLGNVEGTTKSGKVEIDDWNTEEDCNDDGEENLKEKGRKDTLADNVKCDPKNVEGITASDKAEMEDENIEENFNDDAEKNTGRQDTLGDSIKGNPENVEGTAKANKAGIDNEDGLVTIPPQLAIPWFTICCKLDLPFILTAALDLWNWRLQDPTEAINLSNLTLISSMTGTESETYFHMVPCAMQMAAGPVIPRAFAFYEKMKLRGTKGQEKHGIKMNETILRRTAASKEAKIDSGANETDNAAAECREHDEHTPINGIFDVAILITLLSDVAAVFEEFKEIAKQIKDLVDKDMFYDIYRPLLSGFWPDGVVLDLSGGEKAEEFEVKDLKESMTSSGLGNMKAQVDHRVGHGKGVATDLKFLESSMTGSGISDCKRDTKLPDASARKTVKHKKVKESFYQGVHDNLESNRQAFLSVIKERLSESKLIVYPKGPSAGQSTMILLFDLLLGIHHVGSGKEFQTEMLNYMPWQHRQMITDFRELVTRFGSVRDIILKMRYDADYAQIVAAFNACVNAVAAFRALHLGIAVKYLVRAEKGTGSSSFRDMLNVMVQGTRNALI